MIRRTLFWLLLPLSSVQGLWLRRHASRLPGAPGDRQGSVGSGEALYLLAIGDSIIDGVGTGMMEESLPVLFAQELAKTERRHVIWRVEGQSGLDAAGLLKKLDALASESADVILISIGVNDVTGLSSTRHWRRTIGHLLDQLQSRWPEALIIFAGLPPMSEFPLLPQPLRATLGLRAHTLDSIASELIANLSRATHIPTLIDPKVHTFSVDGFHPSSDSCVVWARELARLAAKNRELETS
jgi:lysophospholipase L1-like esterase